MEKGMSKPLLRALLIWSVLATAVPIGVLADPGTITKYVLPDGRVVYSDKPVPGAKAEKEIVVEPGPPAHTPRISQGTASTTAIAKATEKPSAAPQTGADDPAVSQALNQMLSAASGFAATRTAGWNANTLLYAAWRVGHAEIKQDCFWGREGTCIFDDMTDKQVVAELFSSYQKGEASDDRLQQWIKEDQSALPFGAYFAGKVLSDNIYSTYVEAEKSLRGMESSAPSPDLVLAYTAALARKLREENGQSLEGWGIDQLLGWIVLYHPGLGRQEGLNVASLFADIPVPYREAAAR
jgi:hypothetical protein